MPHHNSQSKFEKHPLSKRFSKVLSKMFWHLNEAIPAYPSIYRTTSVDKRKTNSNKQQQQPIVETNHDQIPCIKSYRSRPIRRIGTLTSIKEENEIEIMNSK